MESTAFTDFQICNFYNLTAFVVTFYGSVLHSLEETKCTRFFWINKLIISGLGDTFSWKKVFALFF